MQSNEKRLMDLGIFIFNIILFTIFASTLIFMFGGSINKLNIFIGIIGSIAFCFFATKKSIKETAVISAIAVSIFAIFVLICSGTFEWTVDGNVYRKSMIGMLNLGWNPLTETFYSAADPYPFLDTCTQTWYDAYPKATEIFAASVYSVTGNIESGKCFTLLAMVGAFSICASYLMGTGKLKRYQAVLCAGLCIFNPVNLAQCFTFYNDAFLGILLIICLASMLNLTFYEHKKSYMRDYWLIFLSICLGLNSKFSALIFFAGLCLAFFGYWIWEKCKSQGFKKSKKIIFERFSVFAVSVLSAVLFIGSTSYVTNTIRYHNPVYTMIGEGSTEIITSMAPIAIQEMSHVERFFASFFAPALNNSALEKLDLKQPFDFTNDNLFEAGLVDIRLGGWGVFFSGIFIVALILLVKTLYCWRKRNSKVLKVSVLLAAVFIVFVLFVPGLFWARYFTLPFWIPVAALVLNFIEINEGKSKGFVCGALVSLMLLNTVPNLDYISDRFEEFDQIESDFDLLKMHSLKRNVNIGFRESPWLKYPGAFFNIIDRGIEFNFADIEDIQNSKLVYGLSYSLAKKENETNKLSEYLSSANENWIIIVAAKDEASLALNEEIISSMRSLGLSFNLQNCFRHSYIGIVEGGNVVYEAVSEGALSYEFTSGKDKISVSSAGYDSGNFASININKTNYSSNMRGLNFVIYDRQEGAAIDSFYIDTYSNDLICR